MMYYIGKQTKSQAMNLFFRLNKRINEELFSRFELFFKKLKRENKEVDFVFLMFDTRGGELSFALKSIDLINQIDIKFIGVAYGEVHSSAIPIFLSTHVRFGYEKASALIHRASVIDGPITSSVEDVKLVEIQIFELIAEKLSISIEDVIELADANNGKGTLITMNHPLGKRFFISG